MKPVVIVEPIKLNKEQTRDAFAISDSAPLWVAIMQTIRDLRMAEQSDQLAGIVQNNPLLLAASCGAVNTLDNLLVSLESARSSAF